MIINLGSKKGKNNDNSSCQITCLHNELFMIFVDTPENDLFNVDQKYDMREVRKYSVKSSSTLFNFQYVQCII